MPPTGKAKESCLVVVDVQYDFMPGGALAVANGDEVVPAINALLPRFENVVQDGLLAGTKVANRVTEQAVRIA